MTEKNCDTCDTESCSAKDRKPGEELEAFVERQELSKRMCRIKHKVLVLSGKGGVGKSTVASNLAAALVDAGQLVGLLDIDVHGPSIPKLFGMEGRQIQARDGAMLPVELPDGLKVMSIGFMLQGSDDAVIWRGPLKMGVIKQFLKDVDWGELDYLVIDSPPGTGDEPLSICQLIPDADGAIIVTTPQEVALADVRKSISFCRKVAMRVLGVIENMSGFMCPKCGEVTEIFRSGGGKAMALSMGVPFLGAVPLDPGIVLACDGGMPYVKEFGESPTAEAIRQAIKPILELDGKSPQVKGGTPERKENRNMRIAIPTAGGKLAMHFGHCEVFVIVEADVEKKDILGSEVVEAPAHEPGALPRFLAEKGADMIIAGGMGSRAQALFSQNGIEVVVGAPSDAPEAIVQAYLDGKLESGGNICDH